MRDLSYRTKAIAMLLGAWTVLGLIGWWSYVFARRGETRLPVQEKLIPGTITQIENKSGAVGLGTSYIRYEVTVRFSPQSGKTLETTNIWDSLKFHGSNYRLRTGDTVYVVYDPAKPQNTYVWNSPSRGIPLIVFVVVVLPGFICYGILQSIGLKLLSDKGDI